jgi:hypothetical protein
MAKYLDGIQNVQGLAGLPKLIGSFSYSDFKTPSATKTKFFPNTLIRNAKARTILFNSTLNQTTGTPPLVTPYDSTVGVAWVNSSTTLGPILANTSGNDTSERLGILASHVDSIGIGIPMGATLPTSGKLDVYIVEYF